MKKNIPQKKDPPSINPMASFDAIKSLLDDAVTFRTNEGITGLTANARALIEHHASIVRNAIKQTSVS